MFDIQKFSVELPEICTAREDIVSAVREFVAGRGMKERALYRIYRIWNNRSYLDMYSEDPESGAGMLMFPTWSDFIDFVTESVDISKSTIYSRLKAYSLFDWMGYTQEESLRKMSSRANLYTRALDEIVDWDSESRSPTAFRTDLIDVDIDDPIAPKKTREIILELESYESIGEAIRYLRNDLMQKPEISISICERDLRIRYAIQIVDSETGEITNDYGEILFESNDSVPDWIYEELERRYKIRNTGKTEE